jgi:hypothetical protein
MTKADPDKKKSKYRVLAALIGLFFVVLIILVFLLGIVLVLCGKR